MIFALLGIVIFLALYIYVIIDLQKTKSNDLRAKANSLTLIFFFPLVGAIIYLVNKRRNSRNKNPHL